MSDKLVHVKAYTKDDGTKVKEHYRGGEEAFQDDGQVPLLTGGVSEEVYYPLPDDNLEMEQGFSEAVQVAMAFAQMSISIAAAGMKIVSELKSASEQSSTKLGIQLEEVVGQMRQAHDVSVSAEQKTLERLSNTTNQREYKELYDTYLAQRESNRATGAIINRIAYSTEHKNYDDVEKGLNEYKSLHTQSAQSVMDRANLNAQPTSLQFEDQAVPVSYPSISENMGNLVRHTVVPNVEKQVIGGLANVGGVLGVKDANMLWKIATDDVNGYKNYVEENGYFVESISDLPFDFKDTVRAKVKQQLHVDDAKGLILKPESSLSKKVANCGTFKQFLKSHYKELINGQVISGSIAFPWYKNFNIYGTLGKADILDTYINTNGDIVSFVLDTYEFNKNAKDPVLNTARDVQEHGLLSGYFSVTIIVIPYDKWLSWFK